MIRNSATALVALSRCRLKNIVRGEIFGDCDEYAILKRLRGNIPMFNRISCAAPFVLVFLVAGCFGTDVRSEANRLLNGEARGQACVVEFKFTDGSFQKAVNERKVVRIPSESGLLGNTYGVADIPGSRDQWIVFHLGYETNPLITRRSRSKDCLPGKVEIQTVADFPLAPNNDSYKLVEFLEVVTIPPELQHLKPYIFDRYRKEAVFQKTDRGWRVAR